MGLREWRDGGEGFFEEVEGVVLGTPVADVGEVEVALLDGEDIFDIVDVFGAAAAFGPAEFGDDDVFGAWEEGADAAEGFGD